MRKALVVGIDHYENDGVSSLSGAVSDANSVKAMLDRHADGSVNFDTKFLAGTSAETKITRSDLKEAVRELFSGDGTTALFYFSGHGFLETTGGYLCASDCTSGDDGLPLSELMIFANESSISNRIVILDSCHSGIAGNNPIQPKLAELNDGVTVLTASTAEQYAMETASGGVFTNLMIDALGGAAANLVGDVTPGAIYAHVDQSLGSWGQRPVFKTNVQQFVSLRKVAPPIELSDLQKIAQLFPSPGFHYQLDPSYEPERLETKSQNVGEEIEPSPENNAIFAVLQKYNRLGLLVPENAPHMWHAAMQSSTVKLTALGEHYRRLVADGRI